MLYSERQIRIDDRVSWNILLTRDTRIRDYLIVNQREIKKKEVLHGI